MRMRGRQAGENSQSPQETLGRPEGVSRFVGNSLLLSLLVLSIPGLLCAQQTQQPSPITLQAREQAGLTQAAVASALGYKRQYHISQIENANRILDPIELENFARLYRKTLNDFATVIGDQAGISRFLNRMSDAQRDRARRKT
jgi:DNA-binding XRE family transcriptional regulator